MYILGYSYKRYYEYAINIAIYIYLSKKREKGGFFLKIKFKKKNKKNFIKSPRGRESYGTFLHFFSNAKI